MRRFVIDRAILLLVMILHSWWGAAFFLLPYPASYGGTDFLVQVYGLAGTRLLLLGSAVSLACGLHYAYWRPQWRRLTLLACMPQEVLVLQMALGALYLWWETPHNVRQGLSLGYLVPMAGLHTMTLIDVFQRQLQHRTRLSH